MDCNIVYCDHSSLEEEEILDQSDETLLVTPLEYYLYGGALYPEKILTLTRGNRTIVLTLEELNELNNVFKNDYEIQYKRSVRIK